MNLSNKEGEVSKSKNASQENNKNRDAAVKTKRRKLEPIELTPTRVSERLKHSKTSKYAVLHPRKPMIRTGTTTVLHQHNPITIQQADLETAELEPSSQSTVEHRQIVPDKSLMAPPSSDIQNGNGCSQSPSDIREPMKDDTTDSGAGSLENSPENGNENHNNGDNNHEVASCEVDAENLENGHQESEKAESCVPENQEVVTKEAESESNGNNEEPDNNEESNDVPSSATTSDHSNEVTAPISINVEEQENHQAKNDCVSPSSSTVSSSFDTNSHPQPSPSTSVTDQHAVLAAQPSPAAKSLAETLKRTRTRKPPAVEEASRKSNRINRCVEAEAEVVENYTEPKLDKPRSVQIPIGVSRNPYLFPRRTSKEKDRLRIDMKGPSTRANPNDVLYMPLSHVNRDKHAKKESKAVVPDLLPIENALEDKDREESIWVSSELDKMPDCDVLDPILTTIHLQYDGTIPFDAVLRRLMVEGYDIDRMLETIELERERLPQPLEPFMYIQQMEYQKMMSKIYGTYIRPYKTFRGMQEKFLREYHLGEIVQYYYSTKRRGCSHKLYTRCGCQENLLETPPSFIERVECENCTKSMRPMAVGTDKFCGICKLFFERNNRHRNPCGMFTDREMKTINMWNKIEEETGERVTLKDVRARIEAERAAELATKRLTTDEVELIRLAPAKDRQNAAKLLASFDINRVKTCDSSAESLEFRLKKYDRATRKNFIRAIEKFGKDFQKVGDELNVSKEEAAHFFHQFNSQFKFDQMIAYNKRTNYLKECASRESTPYDAYERSNKSKQNRKRNSDQAYGSSASKRKNVKK